MQRVRATQQAFIGGLNCTQRRDWARKQFNLRILRTANLQCSAKYVQSSNPLHITDHRDSKLESLETSAAESGAAAQ